MEIHYFSISICTMLHIFNGIIQVFGVMQVEWEMSVSNSGGEKKQWKPGVWEQLVQRALEGPGLHTRPSV